MTRIVFPDNSTALAKKYLSQHHIRRLEHLKTGGGFTLAQAVASGIRNPDSHIGIYAGDEESYHMFSPVFDPVIAEYHNGRSHNTLKKEIPLLNLSNPDPNNRFILSTRIRVARNLAGFAFPCHISRSHRESVELHIKEALRALPGDLEGSYHPLKTMASSLKEDLRQRRMFLEKGDRFQDAAGINRDFPHARGVFLSRAKTLLIWVNEEDHMRIISMEKSADLSTVFNRLAKALKLLEGALDFAWSKGHGYLASCPTNIGTAMRAGVHIRLEKLQHMPRLLSNIAEKHSLQIRGTAGEKTKVENAVFDISNKQRLGICESDILRQLHSGICDIIQAETSLS